jgi:carboxymethylenebutenolidase
MIRALSRTACVLTGDHGHAAAPVPPGVGRYPNAQHGFHCDDRPAVYDRDSALDGWARTLAFIGGRLG